MEFTLFHLIVILIVLAYLTTQVETFWVYQPTYGYGYGYGNGRNYGYCPRHGYECPYGADCPFRRHFL